MPMPMDYQHASEEFERFLRDAISESGLTTRNQIYTMAQGVLQVFRRRLDVGDAVKFVNVLPPILRAIFVSDWDIHAPDLWYALIERNASLVTSEIGVAECLFGAFRQGSRELEQGYERLFFHEDAFDIQPVNLEALIEAGRLGASQAMRLIDAVHFHAAATSKCEIFVTNDRCIRSSHGVRVIYISEH
jgi:predicted nucleic acid-binding protein